jgi:peptidoglycan/LPS O-acetylase OafA/YrhL
MAPHPNNHPLNSLTGARFIAAIVVVLFHLQYENWAVGNQSSAIGLGWVNRGYLGVDFFFILSGFILAYAHSELSNNQGTMNDYKTFMIKRFARIYPVYIFSLILWVALECTKYINTIQSNPIQSNPIQYNSVCALEQQSCI